MIYHNYPMIFCTIRLLLTGEISAFSQLYRKLRRGAGQNPLMPSSLRACWNAFLSRQASEATFGRVAKAFGEL